MAAHKLLLAAVLSLWALVLGVGAQSKLSKERMVFQTDFGDIHMAFYPEVAPKTVAHIRRLGELGAYNTNHFFRVDKGFVAQTADVLSGRKAPLNALQKLVAGETVPLEAVDGVKHDKRGILSMARHADPNSGGSSFSVLLGPAPHLDMQYTVFGEVTEGLETLERLEEVETRKEGIFVMPLQRISIRSTYMYLDDGDSMDPGLCLEELRDLEHRFVAQATRVEELRRQALPG
ncbi:hypothetical protein N2152v2_004109 [Parachlorella kessleri]